VRAQCGDNRDTAQITQPAGELDCRVDAMPGPSHPRPRDRYHGVGTWWQPLDHREGKDVGGACNGVILEQMHKTPGDRLMTEGARY
jgi:hypothetical protein